MNDPRLLLAAALAFASLPAAVQGSPFRVDRCPIADGAQGYPVWVKAADGTTLDSAFAHALADAVARRWEPPSARRGSIPGLSRLRSRILPPEPRWPEDWSPEARHVARGEVTLRRAGRPALLRVVQPSGDRAFDRSLEPILRDGAPASPDLPALPAGLAGDSLRVTIGFGGAPEAGAAVVRFAVHQEPVRVVPGSLNVLRPAQSGTDGRPPAATVKYDVDPAGRLVPGSVEVLDSSDRAFAAAVRDGLIRARFTPAQSNCRPVSLSVVQTFGGR